MPLLPKELLSEIECNYNDKEPYNFKIVAVIEKDQALFDFDPYSNLNMNAICRVTSTKVDSFPLP